MGRKAREAREAREARTPKPFPPAKIVLEAADYWRLRALAEQTTRVRMEAEQALAKALRDQAQAVQEAATKYHFDPKVPAYKLDDATLTLEILSSPPKGT